MFCICVLARNLTLVLIWWAVFVTCSGMLYGMLWSHRLFWGLGCRSRSICFFAVSCVGCAWLAVSSVSLSVAPLSAFHGKSVHVSSAFEVVFLCCFLHAFLCSCAWWAVASWSLRMHPWVEPSLPLWLVSVEVEHAFSELLAP